MKARIEPGKLSGEKRTVTLAHVNRNNTGVDIMAPNPIIVEEIDFYESHMKTELGCLSKNGTVVCSDEQALPRKILLAMKVGHFIERGFNFRGRGNQNYLFIYYLLFTLFIIYII